MIEIHTKIFCKCGMRYYHMFVGNIPLAKKITLDSECPECKNKNTAVYVFDTEYKCNKWYSLKKHYITEHFCKNEGEMEEELYPRECCCGEKVNLKQRRIQ